MSSEVASGAVKGAAAGFSVGGPWGAAIGGIIGGIGGMFADDAAKYRRRAAKEEDKRTQQQQAVQRRDLVRSLYINRATNVAAAAGQESGGLQSSAFQGVNSSALTQGKFNLDFFDAQVVSQIFQQKWLKKAGKKQAVSDTIGSFVDTVGSSNISFGTGAIHPPGNSAARGAAGSTIGTSW